MKKIYSLIATALISTAVFAQGAETFQSQTILSQSGTAYADGTFNGETSGVTVNFQHSRDEGDYAISGKGLMLRRIDAPSPSFVEFVIPNGVGTFTFEYRKAFTAGTNNRILAVFVNGNQANVTPLFGSAGTDATVGTLSTPINETGSVTVKIAFPAGTADGNKQITIDNVSWTAAGSLAVADFKKITPNFIKNTLVKNNEIIFGSDVKDIKVYTLSGSVVKTGDVKNGSALNVAELAKGNYIVTGTVNNEPVSQKILKD